jgi:ribosomal protein S18 acetylase RimI-like enzyme
MKPLWQVPLFRRKTSGGQNGDENGRRDAGSKVAAQETLARALLRSNNKGVQHDGTGAVRQLPRPAMRWVGPAGRAALRPFDFDADANAVCAFQEETYSLNFPVFRYDPAFAAAFRQDLRRASLDGQHGLFVLDESRLIGFLWIVICHNSWTNERFGYVNNLYIVPERRGLGLGRELMKHSDDFFRSRGVKIARLTVTATNEAACALYSAAGYTTERFEMEKEL